MKWKGKSVKEKHDSKRRKVAKLKKNNGRKKMKVIKKMKTKNEGASKKNNEDGTSGNNILTTRMRSTIKVFDYKSKKDNQLFTYIM
ncbi:hypothetical protein MTR_4g045800 [Medicago truncatula]|uniref:Uncharacterized protein n=1 Tax=Medicago truncatula TaxID=3880 RepID=A0A072UUN4_MEDTR|nr:hypothetical protein MTR_4g045800 [Medicago truncatula]